MESENRDGHDQEKASKLEVAHRSFHGRLLSRSRSCLPDPRNRGPMARRSGRWSAVGRLIGEGAIFAGGLAIGGGFMVFRRGEPLRGRPGLMIAVGLTCVLAAIFVRVISKVGSKPMAQAARG